MSAVSFSSMIAPVTPPPMCPDLDKYEICSTNCGAALDTCKENCYPADYACPSRCDAAFLDCKYACPCDRECPNGCSGCSNPVCQASDYLLIINSWQAWDNQGFLVNLSTDQISFAWMDYGEVDTEDSCYAFMKGQHYIIGGYFMDRQIASIDVDGCELRRIGYLEVPHIDGMWGSCAVYNDVTHLCFDEEGVGEKGCQTFDGSNQGIIDAQSSSPHDWSSMAIYDNKMWVVGGCGVTTFGCHNIVEAFDGNSWSVSVPHADGALVGHLVLGDAYGLYTINEVADMGIQYDVQRFDGFSWTKIGELSQAHATSYSVNSGKIVNGYAFIGEDELDKVRLDEEDFTARSLGNDPNGDDLLLYYAPMILVDGPRCAV